ncbi:MAG: four helix bundle protein [Bacteroidota bacterium]
MQDYRKLIVWEKAHKATLEIYFLTKSFPKDELYGIVSQLRRSVSSIPANIVEGCGRKTKADFARFLNIAIGSSNETEYFLLLAKDLGYISQSDHEHVCASIIDIRKMLVSLSSKVQK